MPDDHAQTADLSEELKLPDGSWWAKPLDRFANVEESLRGFTELRIHGVSGPLPGSVLEYPGPVVTLVKGNPESGFWRRWRLGGSEEDEPGRHLEGFCWGGLTSRAHTQALWLLVLPFSLVNLAHWMLLPHENDSKTGRGAMRVAVALLRLVALSFTVTLLLAGAEVTMDIGAWQCSAARGCRDLPGWLTAWQLGTRLAAGGALLAVLLLVLAIAGRARFPALGKPQQAPSPLVPRFHHDEGGLQSPVLGRPQFWAADVSARWLRCLHVAVWCAGIGALATGAVLATPRPGALAVALFWADVAVLGAALVLVIPQWTGRGGQGTTDPPPEWLVWAVALGLLGASLAATAVDLPDGAASSGAHPHLPGLQGAIGWLALGQLAALIVLLACTLAGRYRSGKWAGGYTPMLGGFLPLVVVWLGWFLGLALTAGAGLWVAARLQKAVVPPVYAWIDAAAVLAVAVLAGTVPVISAVVALRTQKKAREVWGEAAETVPYGDPAADRDKRARARSAARVWILAQSVEGIPWILAIMAAVTAIMAVFAVIRFWYFRHGMYGHWFWQSGWLARKTPQVGAWIIVAGTVVIVVVAYGAFRSQSKRRVVGILWDVTTFWPRANHPFTPPCSAERAVPQLADRIDELTKTDGDLTVVSAHSQGSVLAAAAALTLGQRASTQSPGLSKGRIALLTYGSPLRRLYARGFPAYFSAETLQQVSADLHERWVNLWAHTDPIGARICLRDCPWVTDELMAPDPLTLGKDPRTGLAVPVCDHSGYRDRPEYQKELKELSRRLQPPPDRDAGNQGPDGAPRSMRVIRIRRRKRA